MLTRKRESTYQLKGQKRIPRIESNGIESTATTATTSIRVFPIHSFPALINNRTSSIILVLSKLISLASAHDFQPAMTMVGQQASTYRYRSDALTIPIINEYVSIYKVSTCLVFASTVSIALVTV